MKNEDIKVVLEQKKQNLLDDLQALERVILTFNTPNGNSLSITDNYDNTENDRQKVSGVIKLANRFLKVREIAIKLNENEPSISVDDWVKKVSPVLSYLKKNNSIVKYVEGKSHLNTFWGSPKWLDENGKIKTDHMYDKSQIHKKENYMI